MIRNATGVGTFPKNAAFGRYLRVVMSGGNIALAGAHDIEMGTLSERVLASGLGAGSVAPVVFPSAQGTHMAIADGAITQYARVYRGASGKLSPTANGTFYGFALTATTADGDEFEVLRATEPGATHVYNAVAASAEVENTTTETNFDKNYSIPANTLQAGDVLRVRAQAFVVDNNSTDTLTLRLKIGTTVIVATAAVDVADNDIGYIDALIVIRTNGASGTMVATGLQALGVEATVTAEPFKLASTAIDTTAAQVLAVSAEWSVAHADNEVRLDVMHVELLRN